MLRVTIFLHFGFGIPAHSLLFSRGKIWENPAKNHRHATEACGQGGVLSTFPCLSAHVSGLEKGVMVSADTIESQAGLLHSS